MWEKLLQFSRTYYVDQHSASADDEGPGSKDHPFRTIGKAAQLLEPGERVIIAEGIYRECVRPARGGTGPDKMISYEAAPGAKVIVSGSAVIKDGWQPSSGFTYTVPVKGTPKIWQIQLDGTLFGGYNPFGMLNIPQQKHFLTQADQTFNNLPYLRTSVNNMIFLRHRGIIFVDGKPIDQVDGYTELGEPSDPLQPYPTVNLDASAPQFEEVGGAGGRVWAENNGMTLHVRFPDDDSPDRHTVEITTKEQVFAPAVRGLGFIRIKGLTFQHAGNGFPMPQRGMVSTNRGNHWIFEDNTFEWANSIGLDIGNEEWNATRPAQPLGFDIIRGNIFRYCGVEGIGGTGFPGGLRQVLVEKNLFEWIGWQDAQAMSESAAMKLHNAIDLLFRDNVVRHIRHANGVWLDIFNENVRLTGNIFADIPGRINPHAVHIEGSDVPNLVDNNVFSSVTGGVLIRDTNNLTVANNLFLDCVDNGVSGLAGLGAPRIIHYGFTHDGWNNRVYNNVFNGMQRSAIEFTTARNEADGNLYGKMPPRGGYLRILQTEPPEWLDLATWREFHGWDKNGRAIEIESSFDPDTLQLTLVFQGDVPKVPALQKIDTDFFGMPTGPTRIPGPFADLQGGFHAKNIDPRK